MQLLSSSACSGILYSVWPSVYIVNNLAESYTCEPGEEVAKQQGQGGRRALEALSFLMDSSFFVGTMQYFSRNLSLSLSFIILWHSYSLFCSLME